MLGALLATLVTFGCGAAFAQDQKPAAAPSQGAAPAQSQAAAPPPGSEPASQGENADKGVFKKILGGIGLRPRPGPEIDYRERAPLVIPPTTDLPPPESANAMPAEWPKDRGTGPKRAMHERRERGTASGDKPPDEGFISSAVESTESWFSDITGKGGGKVEQRTFRGEPRRVELTDPPPGYQVPSPNYPYGIGPAKPAPKPDANQTIEGAPAAPGSK